MKKAKYSTNNLHFFVDAKNAIAESNWDAARIILDYMIYSIEKYDESFVYFKESDYKNINIPNYILDRIDDINSRMYEIFLINS